MNITTKIARSVLYSGIVFFFGIGFTLNAQQVSVNGTITCAETGEVKGCEDVKGVRT